jgi:hypothetical protein
MRLLLHPPVPAGRAERCLGHKLKGMQGIYQKHDFLEQTKAAWEAWGEYVEKLVR